MPEVRQRFSEDLRALEDEVQRTAAQAQLLLEQALQALLSGDLALCDEVVRGYDEVDALYLDVERRILHLFALQTPVATDLRLLTALLHINLHLERVGDQAVNLAKIAKLTRCAGPSVSMIGETGSRGGHGGGQDREWSSYRSDRGA